MNKKTLLIGGAGFLGNSLAKHLSDGGIPVWVLDSKQRLDRYAIPQPNAEYIPCSWSRASKYPDLRMFDNVIHLAWSTHPASSMTDITKDASMNILGTLKLLESIPVGGIQKFIFMSSGGTVYGNNSNSILSETCESKPISAYGISKLTCEKYVDLYALNKKFSPVNIRLGNPYGGYQLQGTPIGVVANFVKKIFSGNVLELYGDGGTARDYLYIDDFNRSMERIINSDRISGTYNLGSGVGVSLSEIINIIQKITNRSFQIKYMKSRRSDVRSVILNSEKLQQVIGRSELISIEEGIANVVESYTHEHDIAA